MTIICKYLTEKCYVYLHKISPNQATFKPELLPRWYSHCGFYIIYDHGKIEISMACRSIIHIDKGILISAWKT